jgi:hypothetical protein
MFIQYWQQTNHSTRPILPLHIVPKRGRQITTDPSRWPIVEPLTPATRTARMGCGPSRPSRSFYNEYFVEQPGRLQVQRQPDEEGVSRPPMIRFPPRIKRRGSREVASVEEGARGDLKIYAEEVEARKREEEERTFVLHAAVRGDQVFF